MRDLPDFARYTGVIERPASEPASVGEPNWQRYTGVVDESERRVRGTFAATELASGHTYSNSAIPEAISLDSLRETVAKVEALAPKRMSEGEVARFMPALDKLSGADLDKVGDAIGMPRDDGRPDDNYRRWLQCQVLSFARGGMAKDFWPPLTSPRAVLDSVREKLASYEADGLIQNAPCSETQ